VIDDLARELAAVGIHGRRRRRILAELGDHLGCDPDADLGDPRELAAQFANELASDAARRTALLTFGALGLTAGVLVVTQASLPLSPDITAGRSLLLAGSATFAMVVGAQVAFAAGSLAALRAFRLRRAPLLPAGEVIVLRRRVAVALAAGALTAAGSALYTLNFWALVPGWWAALTLAASGAAMLPLGASLVAHARASSLRVSVGGAAGGLSADLGLRARPALIGAAVVTLMLLATGVAERSFVEGALRAGFEACAFTGCYLVFRRSLALSD
jgi:uncharacterized membrane protein YccF (DUF307 family)